MISNKNAPKTTNQKPLSTTKPTTSALKSTTTSTTGPSTIRKPVGAAGKKVVEEEKKESIKPATKTGFTGKPSDRFLNVKVADPFAPKTNVKKFSKILYNPHIDLF